MDLALLALRLVVGLLLFLSGRGKLYISERRELMRETLVAAGVPFADVNVILFLPSSSSLAFF